MRCLNLVAFALLLLSYGAAAQQLRSAVGTQPPPGYTATTPKASNPGAEPLKCQQHADPRIRLYCTDIERSLIQSEARRQGIPTPSSEIVRMPAYGSALSNGWEQLRNAKGEWLRCRE